MSLKEGRVLGEESLSKGAVETLMTHPRLDRRLGVLESLFLKRVWVTLWTVSAQVWGAGITGF